MSAEVEDEQFERISCLWSRNLPRCSKPKMQLTSGAKMGDRRSLCTPPTRLAFAAGTLLQYFLVIALARSPLCILCGDSTGSDVLCSTVRARSASAFVGQRRFGSSRGRRRGRVCPAHLTRQAGRERRWPCRGLCRLLASHGNGCKMV